VRGATFAVCMRGDVGGGVLVVRLTSSFERTAEPDTSRMADTPPARSPSSEARGTDPRHAATVVIARPGIDGPEIYMVRRSAKSPFMPSTLVFPGGRLDPEDGAPSVDSSWERAARRECLEEAGIALAERPLGWFDTWLTPSAEPRRRYLARFYLAHLEHGEGDEACADGHETHAGRWSSVDAHLRAWDAGEVDLPPPTLCILLRLRSMPSSPKELEAPCGVVLPKYVFRDGRHFVVMPHDPEYDELPGEGQPAPPHVQPLPMRFVRDERVWRPCSTKEPCTDA
jgi:8-oxo-dGTP pyrophosphatase MutT (NUDIX family)